MGKNILCSSLGIIGSVIASLFGGWNNALTTLLIFMCIDYITGLIVAGVFHTSSKTPTGALQSRECWKGLCLKGVSLLIVIISHRLDLLLNCNYVMSAVCIAFITNETISIVENAGLMGIPIPKIIIKAIDVLKQKGEAENDD